jgi:hypothetical protein
MTETPDKASAANGNLAFRFAGAGMVVLLPVLYVASIGPACWLLNRGWISPTAEMVLTYFYLPIAWGVRNLPAVQSSYEAYLAWWIA